MSFVERFSVNYYLPRTRSSRLNDTVVFELRFCRCGMSRELQELSSSWERKCLTWKLHLTVRVPWQPCKRLLPWQRPLLADHRRQKLRRKSLGRPNNRKQVEGKGDWASLRRKPLPSLLTHRMRNWRLWKLTYWNEASKVRWNKTRILTGTSTFCQNCYIVWMW